MRKLMKSVFRSSLIIFGASLFIKAGCSKSADDVIVDQPLPTSEQYITWSINNINGSLQSPSDSLYCNTQYGPTSIYGNTPYNATNQGSFSTAFSGSTPGTYKLDYLSISLNGHAYTNSGAPTITVTTFGTVGQYVIGSYSGTLKDSSYTGQPSTNTYSIKGNFKVKRQ